jgi:hypothetical protein
VSSAILYLAIIAIWAGFLVPAWLRRPHGGQGHSSADAAAAHDHAVADYPAAHHPAEYVTETESDVEVSVEADFHVAVTQHEHAAASGEPAAAYATDHVADPASYQAAEPGGGPAGPSQSRAQMLRARRRMLTILLAMTLVTVGFAYLGLVRWWICLPPSGLLVLYLLLLREVATADAQLARKRAAWERAQARAYERYLRAEAEREAYEASLADSGAQIIDISGRVSDELYDQYADAAVRAVGD